MVPTIKQLEARLARVEKELADLRRAVLGQQGQPWYEQIAGSFAGDKVFVENIRLGRLVVQRSFR
jgi:hypothetical protein